MRLVSLFSLRYPPYTEKKESWMVSILSKKRTRKVLVAYFPLVMLGVLLAIVFKVKSVAPAPKKFRGRENVQRPDATSILSQARVWRVAVQFLSALSQVRLQSPSPSQNEKFLVVGQQKPQDYTPEKFCVCHFKACSTLLSRRLSAIIMVVVCVCVCETREGQPTTCFP